MLGIGKNSPSRRKVLCTQRRKQNLRRKLILWKSGHINQPPKIRKPMDGANEIYQHFGLGVEDIFIPQQWMVDEGTLDYHRRRYKYLRYDKPRNQNNLAVSRLANESLGEKIYRINKKNLESIDG